MTNKLTVLFKMMILTMLDMVDFELSAAQMGEFMVGNDYMSFFRFQSLLYEMEQDELIACKREHHNSFYSLNENGRHTLEYFRDKLPEEMRAEIAEYVRDKRWEMRETTSVRTDYTLNDNREYAVRLQVLENNLPQIDLTLTVPDEETTNILCEKWRERNEDIYAYLMRELL